MIKQNVVHPYSRTPLSDVKNRLLICNKSDISQKHRVKRRIQAQKAPGCVIHLHDLLEGGLWGDKTVVPEQEGWRGMASVGQRGI